VNKKIILSIFVILSSLFIFASSLSLAKSTQASTDSADYEQAKKEWQAQKKNLQDKLNRATVVEKKWALEKAKAMVEKAIDRAVAKLQRIIQRIQNSKVITSDRKNKLVAELNNKIVELQNLKNQVAQATTKEELKTAVSQTKNKFVEIRSIIRRIVDEILASHIDKTIENLNKIVAKLETEITNLKNKGQDVTKLEQALAETKALITNTKTKNDEGSVQEARRLVEQARNKLVKLYGQIRSTKAKLQGGENENQ